MREVLTTREMAEVDRRAIAEGPLSGPALMERAGAAVVDEILRRFPETASATVLCGPGNNGGDGYVVARLLQRVGVVVRLLAEGLSREGSDAAHHADQWREPVGRLSDFVPEPGGLVVDALYGAGLLRPVSQDVVRAIELSRKAGCRVVSVDLPSGVAGESGQILGDAFDAALTVTFVRRKPGHLLLPGRVRCGETLVADIGISDRIVSAVGSSLRENVPSLWSASMPRTTVDAHKYSRGHVAVVSGGATATGAARLAAAASARSGAGAVTVLSPAGALQANAAHLTSTMLRQADGIEAILSFIGAKKPSSIVYGPGLEPDAATLEGLVRIADVPAPRPALVADAGALSALAADTQRFFTGRHDCDRCVLTPHEGEFARVFPDLAHNGQMSKIDRTRAAASRAGAVVVYKGPDTVVAAADGRASIAVNGTSLLATAGSGDVLSGLIAGLLAQGMPAFEASSASVWIHAEAARRFGPGLIAEDLPVALLPVLRDLAEETPG